LTLSSTALASTHKPARQYRRELSPENSNILLPRLDVDPTLVCGSDYVDCNNGWCCSEGAKCSTFEKMPICLDPSQSALGGTSPTPPPPFPYPFSLSSRHRRYGSCMDTC
jgi:hypothetical protein